MILNELHFSKQIENINQILWNNDFKVVSLAKGNLRKFKKEEILYYYASILQNFPLTIENASNEIGISIISSEFFELYFDLVFDKREISSKKQRDIIEKRRSFNPENHLETVEDFISELFHSLVTNYDKYIENTMKQNYFVGINSEVKVLLSILKIYKNVLKDKTKQIEIFWFLKLTKEISDLILEMLIEFIEERLEVLTITIENVNFRTKTTYIENKIFSIEWKGSQQELCELILELENKKWIGEIKNGERRKIATSITKLFDLSNTQKNENSDTNNSFYQVLKGEFEDNKRIFPFLENKKYNRKFDTIKSPK